MSQQERPAAGGEAEEVTKAAVPTSQSQISESKRDKEKERESGQLRPDPAFKEYTAEQARKVGLELRNVELPQLSLTDLVLAVPDNTDLAGTMFDFFGKVNVVEFKSENDLLTLPKMGYNQARAWLMFAKGEVARLEDLMSVFVCAHLPDTVVDFLKGETKDFRREQEWLIRCRLGGIEVAIVVCRLLPLERRYYWWLIFAPSDTPKWKGFVTSMLEQGEREIIDQVKRLRPKEYKKVATSFLEDLKGRSLEEQAERTKDLREIIELELGALEEMNPQEANKVVSKLKPQTLVAGLTPEQIADTLTPNQLTALKPEQRLAGLTPQERKKLLEFLAQEEAENEDS